MDVTHVVYTKHDNFGNSDNYLYQDTFLVDRKKYRNISLVTIRQQRNCASCDTALSKGLTCLTKNKRYEGRKWYCSSCARLVYPTKLIGKIVGYYYHNTPLYYCKKKDKLLGYLSWEEAISSGAVTSDRHYELQGMIEDLQHEEAMESAYNEF